LHYLHFPTLDLTAPTQEQIALAVAFALKNQETSIVYIHCKAGYSRTAVIAAAYLLASGRRDCVDESIDVLRGVRPSMIVRPEARRAIQAFHQGLRETRSPKHLVANTTHRADWEAA
jgi:protein-tyrosine phosphatase